ncbi:MAG: PorT family protein [Muribaculaceae bacterium]|nr:PorT family protein [Muribaculaceae bacterium]
MLKIKRLCSLASYRTPGMRKIAIALICILTMGSSSGIKAQLLDTGDAERFFSLSGRIGFNTSNRTIPTSNVSFYNHESWGTGFNIGALANLNFKNYLALQPGLFFESRSGNYAMATDQNSIFNQDDPYYILSHWRAYYFTIPVMGVVKVNLASNIKVSGEFGPYLQFQLNESGKGLLYHEYSAIDGQIIKYEGKQNKVDFGFKMGVGLQFYQHYYLGVHYLAGVCHAWSRPSGGHNKSWMFTVGYDFKAFK